MKKTLLLLFTTASLVFITSCGDDEEKVDPIIGIWELDDVSVDAVGSEFDYLDASGENNLVGESEFLIEFKADQTFERELEDVLFSDGSTRDIEEEGEWELDGDDLDLDSDDQEINGLPYSFKVEENTGTDLILSYSESGSFFPQSKITEWFEDGTLDSDGFFTVTDAQFDSLVTNFAQNVSLDFLLEFEKQ